MIKFTKSYLFFVIRNNDAFNYFFCVDSYNNNIDESVIE